ARGSGGPLHRARARAYQRADRRGGRDPGHSSQHPDQEDEGVRVVSSPLPPVRVEKALELMPELEALAPLRALLISIARPDERALWSSSGPYLTLGKRGVDPDELRRRLPHALHRIAEHVHALCKTYVEALEARQRGDAAGVVGALVRGGHLEEEVGRFPQARAWYELALSVAEGLQDRRPEVDALRALGYLCLRLGQYGEGARQFQRAFALAEAEFDQARASGSKRRDAPTRWRACWTPRGGSTPSSGGISPPTRRTGRRSLGHSESPGRRGWSWRSA